MFHPWGFVSRVLLQAIAIPKKKEERTGQTTWEVAWERLHDLNISGSLSSIPCCMLAEDYQIKEQRMINYAGPFASVWNNHRDFVGDFVRGDQRTHPYTKKLDRAADIKNEAESISIITFQRNIVRLIRKQDTINKT